ncbi:MAG: hypothetical protein JKY19_08760 [Alcanivoracaceae bacterium]|nr:hypothetical protein [Alcanivoracaceae bacterium]
MPTVKIPLLYLLIIVNYNVNAETLTFPTNLDISSSLNISQQSEWAVNGGIFKPVSAGITFINAGDYQLVIKDSNENLKSYDMLIEGQITDNVTEDNVVIIDNIGPKISLHWQHVIAHENVIVAGANSQLSWQIADDGKIDQQVYINGELISTTNNTVSFKSNIDTVKIVAIDEFGNRTIKEHNIKSDFVGPEIEWHLMQPAIKKNGKWIAAKEVSVAYKAHDESGISYYELNNKKLKNESTVMKMKNNSELIAVDNLGNKTSELITWQIDKKKPVVHIIIDNETYIGKKKFNVKAQQEILVSVEDEGIGLKKAIYYSKNKKWQPLPQTFVFLRRGSNTVLIIAEDMLGNKLKTRLKFKAKK